MDGDAPATRGQRAERTARSRSPVPASCRGGIRWGVRSCRPDRTRADDCAVLDVRALPPAPSSLPIPGSVPRKPFPDAPTRHDLSLSWSNGERLNVTLFTTTTRPFYGGARRWFRCPRCGRRCAKLYTPDYCRVPFHCRVCLQLVYQSQYRKGKLSIFLRRYLLHPPSESTSARRQRDRRRRKKIAAMSEAELLALIESELSGR